MSFTSKTAIFALMLMLPAASTAAPITYAFASTLPNDPGGAAAGSTTADVILTLNSLAPDLDGSGTVGEYAVDAARIEFENGHVSTVSNTGTLIFTVGLGIRWVQPFPDVGDFGGLLGPGLPTTDELLTQGTFPVQANVVNFVTTDDLGLITPFPNALTIVSEPAAGAFVRLGLLGLVLRRTSG